jgi:NAD(P)-dependent dehydrogenase (short-subunit alcohol dehydrogenase family)
MTATRSGIKLEQGLGLEYAQQLVAAGCRCLVLTSRAGTLPASVLREFAAAGVAAFAVAADFSDAASAAAVLEWAREHLPAVEHYAHAAGVSGFALLGDLSDGQLWEVARPKVGGGFLPLTLLLASA